MNSQSTKERRRHHAEGISGAEKPSRATYEALEELVRIKVAEFIQDIVEEEITEFLGRGKSERRKGIDQPEGYRNGYGKPRKRALMNRSTKGWVNQAEKEALVLMSEALDALGDRCLVGGEHCGFRRYEDQGQGSSDFFQSGHERVIQPPVLASENQPILSTSGSTITHPFAVYTG